MDKRLNVKQKKSALGNQHRLIVLLGTLLTLALIIYCAATLVHKHKKYTYTQKTLSLPKADAPHAVSMRKEDAWQTITVQSGDTLGRIFQRAGLRQQTLLALLHNNQHEKYLTKLKQHQEIQFLVHDHQLDQLKMPLTTAEYLHVVRKADRYITELHTYKTDTHDLYVAATVHGSLYGTAKQENIPYKLMQQMTEILNWEIDFRKDVRTGDKFSILYEGFYVGDTLVNTGKIIAVNYINQGKAYHAIHHSTATGHEDYYTLEGNSLKKAFSRYPIQFSHISSTFSLSRMHPALHYRRPHRGIDLAAPIGTPIHATGDGVIQTIGRQNDYGNMIKIVHDQHYASIYGHMLKFQKGLSRGTRVKRGQIIGYVGQTGLATGPHCHYEFHFNQSPRNPATIALPHAAPISKAEMAVFKTHSNTLLARLKLFEDAHYAAHGKANINTG